MCYHKAALRKLTRTADALNCYVTFAIRIDFAADIQS